MYIFKKYIYLGDWWSVSNFKEITGSVAIEFQPHSYVKALDNGQFVLSEPHVLGKTLILLFGVYNCTELIFMAFNLSLDINYYSNILRHAFSKTVQIFNSFV